MKINNLKLISVLALGLFTAVLFACSKSQAGTEPEPLPGANIIENTPYSAIPSELVGTWYPDHNSGPLTTNWEQETFQGEQGFREFRTMVFTGNGKNAYEYRTEITNAADEVKKYFYKIQGTTEWKNGELRFYATAGRVRVFSNKYSGYKEGNMTIKELQDYYSILRNPLASNISNATNYLDAKRFNGGNEFTVRYKKVSGTTGGDGGIPTTNPYSTVPATGSYVKISNQYYPTVTIGDQEWMSVNYYGADGLKDANKVQYGTFYKYSDLSTIPIPSGWRIPTKADCIKLIRSQGIAYDDRWNSTDGSDVNSKKMLGQLMAIGAWKKEDGYANNKSGFAAIPANYRFSNRLANGEGTNCLLWTSEKDALDRPYVFKIIQLPTDTYAEVLGMAQSDPTYVPLRLVKDK